MPRGKYVNHKGRNRHFTNPEELQQETSSEEESSTEDDEKGAAGPSQPRSKTKQKSKKPVSSSEEDDSDESEEDRGKNKGVAALIEIENPNRAVKKATVKVNSMRLDGDGEVEKPELTRREREELEKQKDRQKYEKLHAAGKTSEAKADLARLAIIRQQRAEAAAKRDAEKKALEEKKAGSTNKA